VTARLRLLLAVVLVALFVGGGSTAAWALWTATGTASSSVTIGKLAAAISGTDQMTTTFSSSVQSVTYPLTLTNSSNIVGTTATTVDVAGNSSVALAQAVQVTAWPVSGTAACTTSTAVGAGSVSGTWASLPSLTATLAPGAATVWCVRSSITASAPPSATANVHIVLTTTNGSWTSDVAWGGFYLNSSAASTS
jgi:hypothetical protein